jgi:hypothetical protein
VGLSKTAHSSEGCRRPAFTWSIDDEKERKVFNSEQPTRRRKEYEGNTRPIFPWPVRICLPNREVFMPQTVVLAVGLDGPHPASQTSAWRSAGYFVTSAASIRDAIVHFRDGDFDLVLLGHSIPADSRERLTFLIRASGSRIPVVCITDSSSGCDNFADATIRNEPGNLLRDIDQLMADRAKKPAARDAMPGIAR